MGYPVYAEVEYGIIATHDTCIACWKRCFTHWMCIQQSSRRSWYDGDEKIEIAVCSVFDSVRFQLT